MYSHGLEKIYAFETINPKTVKTVASKTASSSKKIEDPIISDEEVAPEQLILNYGPFYQEALPSFRLQEPVSSLGLSSFALKVLHAQNITTCQDAYNFLEAGSHPSLGQSHIEEIESKISAFLGKHPFKLQTSVDFGSLVRIATSSLSTKDRFCLLARYGLDALAGHTSIEQQEVQRLNHEQLSKIIETAQIAVLKNGAAFIENALLDISSAYLQPWMMQRLGISTESEVLMRLKQLSRDSNFDAVYDFLLLFGEPIKLISVCHKVWASDQMSQKAYNIVEATSVDFFYQPFTTYPLHTLCHFVTKTLCKAGYGFKEGFVIKVLTHSPRFVYNTSNEVLALR